MLRPLKRTRPYFSKRWDTVAKGSCSSHMPLDKRSKKSPNKKTMSQPMPIWTPHQASRVFFGNLGTAVAIPKQNVTTSGRADRYSQIQLPLYSPHHEALDQIYSGSKALQREPLCNAEEIWLIHGSSFMGNGLRRAGDTVVFLNALTEAERLALGTSAQKAGTIALTRVLQPSESRCELFTPILKMPPL